MSIETILRAHVCKGGAIYERHFQCQARLQQHQADEEEGLLDEIQFQKIRFSIFAQYVL